MRTGRSTCQPNQQPLILTQLKASAARRALAEVAQWIFQRICGVDLFFQKPILMARSRTLSSFLRLVPLRTRDTVPFLAGLRSPGLGKGLRSFSSRGSL